MPRAVLERIHRWAFAVAVVGVGVSAFLAWEYARGGTIACPVAGTGCDDVRASAFSSILGVPVPWFGIAFYLMVAGIEILRLEAGPREPIIRIALLLVATVGVLASAWFTYLEAFEIGAWCFWCLVSAACSVALLILEAVAVLFGRHS